MLTFHPCGVQVRDLDNNAQRLMQTHPDQAESIYEHQTEINEMWNTLTIKVTLPHTLPVGMMVLTLSLHSIMVGEGSMNCAPPML